MNWEPAARDSVQLIALLPRPASNHCTNPAPIQPVSNRHHIFNLFTTSFTILNRVTAPSSISFCGSANLSLATPLFLRLPSASLDFDLTCTFVLFFYPRVEYKRTRHEIKKKSSDTMRLQKKVKKASIRGDLQRTLDCALQDVNDKFLLLEETEKQAVRTALIEERSRFCLFVTCLKPVVVSVIFRMRLATCEHTLVVAPLEAAGSIMGKIQSSGFRIAC